MAYVLIHHKVKNIEDLKSVFEKDSPRRGANGCVGARLFRDPQDATLYVGLLEFDDVERARSYAASRHLRGVLGFIDDDSEINPRVLEEYVSMNA